MRFPQFSNMQRYGLFAMGAVLACLLVLHNPSAGYTTSITYYDPWPVLEEMVANAETIDPACDPPTPEQRAVLASQRKYLGRELGHCRTIPVEFLHWRSNRALVSYVATVGKVLLIAGAVLFAGLGWVWVLGDPKIRHKTTFPKGASSTDSP